MRKWFTKHFMAPEELDHSSVSMDMVQSITKAVEEKCWQRAYSVRFKIFGDTITVHVRRGEQAVLVRIEPLS